MHCTNIQNLKFKVVLNIEILGSVQNVSVAAPKLKKLKFDATFIFNFFQVLMI